LAGALEAHPFLRGMGREHINTLAEYATATGFAAGELIFKEGDLANRFYLILEGCVALEAALPGDGAREVERIGPGETLGWSWMFPPFRWHFAARARVPTKAIFIYGTWLLECCEADPALGYELTKRIALVAIGRLQSARSLLAAATSAGRER
jgi:CRP-like cAMP-binding protein